MIRKCSWAMVGVAVLMLAAGTCGAETPPGDAKPGDVWINPKDGAELVWVPAGEFMMGSTVEQISAALEEDPGMLEDVKFLMRTEVPQRNVYLDGYWIYKHPVTVAQYRKFCEATGKSMPQEPPWGWKDDHPVVGVFWQNAADYAKWAEVSLPTEAQWEKAARGTDGRRYPWGNEWEASKCVNYEGKVEGTQPVGSHPTDASPYGCLDMAGNVSEWCADRYDPGYYRGAPDRNPAGPSEAPSFQMRSGGPIVSGARVRRGGSWAGDDPRTFRTTFRAWLLPVFASGTLGFRCARGPG